MLPKPSGKSKVKKESISIIDQEKAGKHRRILKA